MEKKNSESLEKNLLSENKYLINKARGYNESLEDYLKRMADKTLVFDAIVDSSPRLNLKDFTECFNKHIMSLFDAEK